MLTITNEINDVASLMGEATPIHPYDGLRLLTRAMTLGEAANLEFSVTHICGYVLGGCYYLDFMI